METHIKTRMDILIEAPLRGRLSTLLEQHDVSGFTIFPALGGSGTDGNWSRMGQITDIGQMLLFTCVLDESRSADLLAALGEKLADHIGYVTTTEVNVIRPNKFP